MLLLVLAALLAGSRASIGDTSRGYCLCLAECYTDRCGSCDADRVAQGGDAVICPDHCARDPRLAACDGFIERGSAQCVWDPAADEREVVWGYRLIGWTCAGECKYECARRDVAERRRRGSRVVQYHGKWPFRRVWGMEELVSVLASVGNAVPHLIALRSPASRASYAPAGHPQREALLAYSLAGVNAWFWSSCLHTKETWLTERGDYHSAALLILVSLWMAACRALGVRSAGRPGLAMAGVLSAVFVAWVWYMNAVVFDYGLNMRLGVAFASVGNLCWSVWASRAGCCGRRHPTAWKAPVVAVLLSGLAALELLDFSPVLGDMVDAHALWHISTVPLCFFWYGFLRDDAAVWRKGRAKRTDDPGPGSASVLAGPSDARRRLAQESLAP